MALTDEQYAAAAWINFHDLGHTMVVTMTAVGIAESQSSGGDTAQSPGFKAGGTGAAGAFQIQNNHTEDSLGIPGFWSAGLWKNPIVNGKAARKIYDGQGIGAWSAYTNGAYGQYLSRASVAVAAVEAKTGPSAGGTQGGVINQGVTNFGQELLAGAATALSVFGLPTFGAASVAVDGNGNVSTGLDVPSPGDLLKNLFSGIAPALWIGGGAILVMLAIIMLNDIAPTPKAIVKKVVS